MLPIPPLPAPRLGTPYPGFQFGPEELRRIDSIQFTWDGVPGATHYTFAVYREGRLGAITRVGPLPDTRYVIEDLSVLERGVYRWTVSAQSIDAAGEVEQDGATAESRFVIELPGIRAPVRREGMVFYGR